MQLSKLVPYARSAHVPTWKKAPGVLGVLYVVSPLDAIPDVIPILGWLDDIGVAALLVGFIRRELSKFSELE